MPSHVDAKRYSAPLQTQGWHVHSGQNGTLPVVDEKGEPLPCQPAAGTDDGINYYAYYWIGPGQPPTHTALDFYQPPSSQKPGSAQSVPVLDCTAVTRSARVAGLVPAQSDIAICATQ